MECETRETPLPMFLSTPFLLPKIESNYTRPFPHHSFFNFFFFFFFFNFSVIQLHPKFSFHDLI